jgi:PAS domain S-box-containing protein
MTGKSSSAGRRVSSGAGWLLGLIFACLAAGIVGAGYFYYRDYEKHYRSAVERQLSAVAELKVSELVQWRKERLGDGSLFFQNASFSALVRRFLEQPADADADAQRQLQMWIGKYQVENQYDEVRLQDAQGVTRLSSPAGLPAIPTLVAKNVSEVLRSGQVTFEDFYRSEPDQRVHAGVLVPILDEQDASRLLGVIFLRIDPEIYLYPFIRRWPTPSLTAETLFVRREGNEVVYLNELRFQKNTALMLRRPLDQEALPGARAASGQEGVTEGIDYRGMPVVAVLRAIPDSPWSLVAQIDTAEVYAPLRERLWLMVVLIGVVLFGAGAGIALLWRQQRVRFYRERHEATGALHQSEERFRILFEAAADMILQLEITPEGMPVIRDANSATFKLLGYERDELIGQPVSVIEATPDASKAVEERRRNFLSGMGTMFEITHRCKDGTIRDFECSVAEMQIGSKTCAISVERDITARKQAEERNREQAALLDKANDAIYVVALDHTILYWNRGAEQTYGWTSAEVLNRKATELIFPDHAALEALNPVLFKQGSWSGERRQRTKSGGMVEVFSRLTLVRNEQGQPQSVFVIDTDITELACAREAAESATKAKSQFLAMMSHEIRTPMNGVLGFANLLADTRLDEQQRDFLRTIVTSGESLLAILTDILDFSKLEAGRTGLEARPVALRLLVEGVLDLLAAPARAKSLELVYWIEPDVPEGIVGDETALRQILLNLAGNALKFTSAGHVEISVAGAPPGADGTRQLVFHVRDTGIGIPPERQDRLFKVFSQVDASTTRHYGGTGLGLAISQRLVTLMGGEIGVTSEPGKGSDFHFTLRVAEADVTDQLRTCASVAPQEIETALRGRRVLVVDDLPAHLRLLDKILSQYGAGTVAAHSGAEALAALDRQRFDLAVLNYIMPGADGIALATAIRQRADASRLPLILVTSAQPSQTETPPGLFAAVIPKPLHNRQFASAVAQALLGPRLGWPEPPTPQSAGLPGVRARTPAAAARVG